MLGFETSDDAAVYRLNDELAAVLTVDFFTPVVDDPYEFGRVAAANALSDVFAMGAEPKVALNLLALDSSLGTKIAGEILRGGADAVNEAGAFVVGGHTIDDDEPKYGLSVFGTVHPDHIIRNEGAQIGDLLYLTKPLGSGIMSAAHKIKRARDEAMRPVIDAMMELNDKAAQAMIAASALAATDITGFGLAGHLHEMLAASDCAAELMPQSLPLFEGVWEFSRAYCRPGRSFSIQDKAESYVDQGTLSDEEYDTLMGVICDPQTSGGLLIALSPQNAELFEKRYRSLSGKDAACIGRIIKGTPGTIVIQQ